MNFSLFAPQRVEVRPKMACPFSVVVAIDFGTTSSGYAFSFTQDSEAIHMMRRAAPPESNFCCYSGSKNFFQSKQALGGRRPWRGQSEEPHVSAADPGLALPQFWLCGPRLLPRPGPGGGPALAVLRQVQDEDPQHQREDDEGVTDL